MLPSSLNEKPTKTRQGRYGCARVLTISTIPYLSAQSTYMLPFTIDKHSCFGKARNNFLCSVVIFVRCHDTCFGRPRTNNSLVNFQFRFVVCVICVVRCYECGEFGHLSFQCPSNILGDRTVPEKKKKKKSKEAVEGSSTTSVVSRDHASDEEEELEDDWSLGDAIRQDLGP